MVRFLKSLNSPRIVTLVLTLCLVVNGFLLYRHQSTTNMARAPVPAETTSTTDNPVPEAATSEETAGVEGTSEKSVPDTSSTTIEESSQRTSSSEAAPDTPASVAPVSGDLLGGSIQKCDVNHRECARRLVEEAVPGAVYLGGREDLNAYGLGRNREVLYFEDSALGPCEYQRQEYVANDGFTNYAVIIAGAGSFDNKGGSGCIPKT